MGWVRMPRVPPGCPPPEVGADLLVLPPVPLEAEAAVGAKLDDGPAPSVRLHVAVRLQWGESRNGLQSGATRAGSGWAARFAPPPPPPRGLGSSARVLELVEGLVILCRGLSSFHGRGQGLGHSAHGWGCL